MPLGFGSATASKIASTIGISTLGGDGGGVGGFGGATSSTTGSGTGLGAFSNFSTVEHALAVFHNFLGLLGLFLRSVFQLGFCFPIVVLFLSLSSRYSYIDYRAAVD